MNLNIKFKVIPSLFEIDVLLKTRASTEIWIIIIIIININFIDMKCVFYVHSIWVKEITGVNIMWCFYI